MKMEPSLLSPRGTFYPIIIVEEARPLTNHMRPSYDNIKWLRNENKARHPLAQISKNLREHPAPGSDSYHPLAL